MKKKQFGISFFYSFLTHALLFSVIIFLAYYLHEEVIQDENGGGKGEVWVDLKGMNPGDAAYKNSNEVQKKSSKNFRGIEKSKTVQAEKAENNDALKLRQKDSPTPAEVKGNGNSPSSANTASGLGNGAGLGKGNGEGEGQGSASASILGLIRRKIEQAKRYPVLAKARKIQGVAVLSFSINASGGVESLHLVKSSGSELLDEEALATVKRASPLPYYSLPIQISIKFSLE